MSFDLNAILQNYVNTSTATSRDNIPGDFAKVAEKIPKASLVAGVAEALRSQQTPPFAQLVSQLFGRSEPQQRADMLNQLLGAINPSLLASLAGGILGSLLPTERDGKITAAQAAQVSPDAVQEIAQHAERHNPSIVEQMAAFYAQHEGLLKTLGGTVLTVALGRIAQKHSH